MQIFISYAREDEKFVTKLVTDLRQNGAKVWFDLTDAPNSDPRDWNEAVQTALEQSDLLLVVITPKALAHTYLKTDWENYLNTGRPVVAIVAERCPVPDELTQQVDFTTGYDNAFHRIQVVLMENAARLSSSKWNKNQ